MIISDMVSPATAGEAQRAKRKLAEAVMAIQARPEPNREHRVPLIQALAFLERKGSIRRPNTALLQMTKIPDEAVTLILKNENVVLVGTVDSKGVPNISPRFVLAVIENEKLLFADAFSTKTFDNIKAWKKVSVSVLDRDTMGGFQLKGDAEEVQNKELVAQANAKLHEAGISTDAKRAWVVSVNEVYSLKPDRRSKAPIASAYG